MTTHYDILIAGAGPAGSSCALALRNTGLRVALLDKSSFPRDKTCGDALPTPSIRYLREILPEADQEFDSLQEKQRIYSSRIFIHKNSVQVNWKGKAYNSDRLSFDNFLLQLVKKYTNTSILENFKLQTVEQTPGYIRANPIQHKLGLTASIIIGCDGANSVVARKLQPTLAQNQDLSVAVRAYFSNVTCSPSVNEFFLLKGIQGYFWVFPLANNQVNVGMGILEGNGKAAKLGLKNYFDSLLENHPLIGAKFSQATRLSTTTGFKLPLGNKPLPISGNRFMLCGDAAHLIDPLQGHGIDKAIKSGILAAGQAAECFTQNNFSASLMANYNQQVYKAFGPEFRSKYRIMKTVDRLPWLPHVLSPVLPYTAPLLQKIF